MASSSGMFCLCNSLWDQTLHSPVVHLARVPASGLQVMHLYLRLRALRLARLVHYSWLLFGANMLT